MCKLEIALHEPGAAAVEHERGLRIALDEIDSLRQVHEVLLEASIRPVRPVHARQVRVVVERAEEVARRCVLDERVVIGVDGRAGGERGHLLGDEQEVGDEILGRGDAAALQLRGELLVGEGASQVREVELERVVRRHHDHVGRQILGGKGVRVRKHRENERSRIFTLRGDIS